MSANGNQPGVEGARPQHPVWLLGPVLALASAAECLAGAYLGGARLIDPRSVGLALCATGIFAAGSAMGHYCDRERDVQRHPSRPLPTGAASASSVWHFAWALLVIALLGCWAVGRATGAVGMCTGVLAVVYATNARRVWGAGYLTLGAAHASCFLLGTAVTENGLQWGVLPAVAVGMYAVGWAVLRGSRQPGVPQSAGFVALLHLTAAFGVVTYLMLREFSYRLDSLPFIAAAGVLTLPRVVRAVMQPVPGVLLEAVQWSFLGQVALGAGLAAGYAGYAAGLIIAAFGWPIYLLLEREPISLVTDPR